MQDAKVLNKKDIARLNKAIERLAAIGQALLGEVDDTGEEAKPRRRRRRRKVASPAVTPNGGVLAGVADEDD